MHTISFGTFFLTYETEQELVPGRCLSYEDPKCFFSVLLPSTPPEPKAVKVVRPLGMMIGQRQRKATHCKRGHSYENNTYGNTNRCKICTLEALHKSRAKKRGLL